MRLQKEIKFNNVPTSNEAGTFTIQGILATLESRLSHY